MVRLKGESLKRSDFTSALKKIIAGDYNLSVESLGGDFRAAMEFVREIKRQNLEKELTIHIDGFVGSAAAYVVFMLDCKKTMVPWGVLNIHGGRLDNVELNEFFDDSGCRESREYYMANKKFVEKHWPEFLDQIVARNEFAVSAYECLRTGIIHSLKQERLAV